MASVVYVVIGLIWFGFLAYQPLLVIKYQALFLQIY